MKRKITKSAAKILYTLVVVFCIFQISTIGQTNAFFTDNANISHAKFSSGFWIPELSMSVSPEDPDGDDGKYLTHPCVTFEASVVEDVTIWFEFANDGDPMDGGEIFDGSCVLIDRSTDLSAVAVNNANNSWRSNIVSKHFDVMSDDDVATGDVVINELMWMGSKKDNGKTKPDDEWIELRNMTDHGINIKNWDIEGACKGNHCHLEIAGKHFNEYVIPAHGFFLITNFMECESLIDVDPNLKKSSIRLDNEFGHNGRIVLRDKQGRRIDEIEAAKNWPAGESSKGRKWSMQRFDDPSDGWYTCNPFLMDKGDRDKMEGYWDSDARRFNCGTPGHENIEQDDENCNENGCEDDRHGDCKKEDKKESCSCEDGNGPQEQNDPEGSERATDEQSPDGSEKESEESGTTSEDPEDNSTGNDETAGEEL